MVFVAGDLRNGGARGAAEGVQEAAKAIGWTTRVIDGQGTVAGVSSAMSQAIALEAGRDHRSAASTSRRTVDASRTRTSRASRWSAGTATPSPARTARADLHQRHHRPGEGRRGRGDVRRRPDPTARPASWCSPTAPTRSRSRSRTRWRRRSRSAPTARCSRSRTRRSPTSSNRMPQLTTSLLQRYGDKWTYALGINDLYFDFMGPSLAAAGKTATARPRTSPPATAASSPSSASAPASTRRRPSRAAAPAGLADGRRAEPRLRRREGLRLLRAGAPGHHGQHRVRRRAEEHLRSRQRLLATPTRRSGASAASRPVPTTAWPSPVRRTIMTPGASRIRRCEDAEDPMAIRTCPSPTTPIACA